MKTGSRPRGNRGSGPRLSYRDATGCRHLANLLSAFHRSGSTHPPGLAELSGNDWLPGHSQVTVTLDIYGHVMPGMQGEALRKMEELLRGEQNK